MRKNILFRLFLLAFFALIFNSHIVLANNDQEEHIDYFEITAGNENIECVRFTTKENFTKQKPTILHCMGSLPHPIVVTEGDGQFVLPLCNFDYKSLLKNYNIVIYTHPYTPAKADITQLNDEYEYVPDISQPKVFDNRYLDDNHLAKHLERGNAALNYLRNQSWVDKDRILLLGHSQGADVAAHLAFENDDIFAVGYLSSSPTGRMAEFILAIRDAAQSGRISQKEAQDGINSLYGEWREICNGEESTGSGDRNITWTSSSK